MQLVMGELKRRGIANSHTLAYQSRVGPVEWLKPYTDDSIRDLARGGVRSLLAVPISFVSEHIETLEEIDCEYRWVAPCPAGGSAVAVQCWVVVAVVGGSAARLCWIRAAPAGEACEPELHQPALAAGLAGWRTPVKQPTHQQ